jgi:hypothetical protein
MLVSLVLPIRQVSALQHYAILHLAIHLFFACNQLNTLKISQDIMDDIERDGRRRGPERGRRRPTRKAVEGQPEKGPDKIVDYYLRSSVDTLVHCG